MIVGDPEKFAIESQITEAYESRSLFGLGLFVIHVSGFRYGVYEPRATALGCSLQAIRRRIQQRGEHVAPFASEPDGANIADAFRRHFYSGDEAESYFRLPSAEFAMYFLSNELVLVPDGDEAFDDGSYILQFDINGEVRLVAFQSIGHWQHEPRTLRDLILDQEQFYSVLQNWERAFVLECSRQRSE